MDDDNTSQGSNSEYDRVLITQDKIELETFLKFLFYLTEVVKYNLPILMCYFHVIKNCKDNSNKEHHNMVVTDVQFLHFSKNYVEYEINKHIILSKWFSILYSVLLQYILLNNG